jgi:hypothetical protein
VKDVYVEMTAKYPELVDIAKDKSKKSLKPVVKFIDDLDSLEEKMKNAFGSDSVHVMLERAQPEEDPEEDDKRFTPHDSAVQDDQDPADEDPPAADPEPEPPAEPAKPAPKQPAGKKPGK